MSETPAQARIRQGADPRNLSNMPPPGATPGAAPAMPAPGATPGLPPPPGAPLSQEQEANLLIEAAGKRGVVPGQGEIPALQDLARGLGFGQLDTANPIIQGAMKVIGTPAYFSQYGLSSASTPNQGVFMVNPATGKPQLYTVPAEQQQAYTAGQAAYTKAGGQGALVIPADALTGLTNKQAAASILQLAGQTIGQQQYSNTLKAAASSLESQLASGVKNPILTEGNQSLTLANPNEAQAALDLLRQGVAPPIYNVAGQNFVSQQGAQNRATLLAPHSSDAADVSQYLRNPITVAKSGLLSPADIASEQYLDKLLGVLGMSRDTFAALTAGTTTSQTVGLDSGKGAVNNQLSKGAPTSSDTLAPMNSIQNLDWVKAAETRLALSQAESQYASQPFQPVMIDGQTYFLESGRAVPKSQFVSDIGAQYAKTPYAKVDLAGENLYFEYGKQVQGPQFTQDIQNANAAIEAQRMASLRRFDAYNYEQYRAQSANDYLNSLVGKTVLGSDVYATLTGFGLSPSPDLQKAGLVTVGEKAPFYTPGGQSTPAQFTFTPAKLSTENAAAFPPVGANYLPQLGVAGTFLTGIYRAPEIFALAGENLMEQGLQLKEKGGLGNYALGYGVFEAGQAVGAAAYATSFVNPNAVTLSTKPEAIGPEILGIGAQFAAGSAVFGAFESAVGISKLPLALQTGARLVYGTAIGATVSAAEGQSAEDTGLAGLETGGLFALAPVGAKGALRLVRGFPRLFENFPMAEPTSELAQRYPQIPKAQAEEISQRFIPPEGQAGVVNPMTSQVGRITVEPETRFIDVTRTEPLTPEQITAMKVRFYQKNYPGLLDILSSSAREDLLARTAVPLELKPIKPLESQDIQSVRAQRPTPFTAEEESSLAQQTPGLGVKPSQRFTEGGYQTDPLKELTAKQADIAALAQPKEFTTVTKVGPPSETSTEAINALWHGEVPPPKVEVAALMGLSEEETANLQLRNLVEKGVDVTMPGRQFKMGSAQFNKLFTESMVSKAGQPYLKGQFRTFAPVVEPSTTEGEGVFKPAEPSTAAPAATVTPPAPQPSQTLAPQIDPPVGFAGGTAGRIGVSGGIDYGKLYGGSANVTAIAVARVLARKARLLNPAADITPADVEYVISAMSQEQAARFGEPVNMKIQSPLKTPSPLHLTPGLIAEIKAELAAQQKPQLAQITTPGIGQTLALSTHPVTAQAVATTTLPALAQEQKQILDYTSPLQGAVVQVAQTQFPDLTQLPVGAMAQEQELRLGLLEVPAFVQNLKVDLTQIPDTTTSTITIPIQEEQLKTVNVPWKVEPPLFPPMPFDDKKWRRVKAAPHVAYGFRTLHHPVGNLLNLPSGYGSRSKAIEKRLAGGFRLPKGLDSGGVPKGFKQSRGRRRRR